MTTIKETLLKYVPPIIVGLGFLWMFPPFPASIASEAVGNCSGVVGTFPTAEITENTRVVQKNPFSRIVFYDTVGMQGVFVVDPTNGERIRIFEMGANIGGAQLNLPTISRVRAEIARQCGGVNEKVIPEYARIPEPVDPKKVVRIVVQFLGTAGAVALLSAVAKSYVDNHKAKGLE